ncbi:hypothetical protein QCA50_006561 [Cerrena zonata]|uniref:ATP synthase F0 subunit 8 n=1 Tax=Cerrena zonata TaxID=2478898 RepID=A0AAW0GJ61_9APHY
MPPPHASQLPSQMLPLPGSTATTQPTQAGSASDALFSLNLQFPLTMSSFIYLLAGCIIMSYVGGRLLKIICIFARTMVNGTEPESNPTPQAAVHETPTDTSGDPSTPNALLNYLTSWLPGGAGVLDWIAAVTN